MYSVNVHIDHVTVCTHSKPCEQAATKADLEKVTQKVMALGEQLARIEAELTAVGTSVDEVVTSVEGVTQDVAQLKALIEKLQNSQGGVTPEDQATIDKLEATIAALGVKSKSVADAVKALDEATAPTPETPEA